MKFLSTGAEIRCIRKLFIVVYKDRIVKSKLKHEEAISIALNPTLLEELYNGKPNRTFHY